MRDLIAIDEIPLVYHQYTGKTAPKGTIFVFSHYILTWKYYTSTCGKFTILIRHSKDDILKNLRKYKTNNNESKN